MGMNTPTIGPDVLNDLIQDQAHMSKFEAFQAENIVGQSYIFPVERLTGLVDIVPFAVGQLAANEKRRSLVATDDPTPKGNTFLAQMPFKCNEYRFAEPLSKVAGQSIKSFFAEVIDMLRNRAGLRVKVDVELELMSILKGLGSVASYTGATVENISAASRKWDNYAGATHDPWADIVDLQRRTAASAIFIASDVNDALKRSPIFTGSSAGSGKEFLSNAQMIEILMGMGFGQVIIGHQPVNNRPVELPADLKWLHDGVVAMWSPGAIRMYKMEDYQYDVYFDEDRRKEYYRALQTSVFKVPYAEGVGVFQNVLT